MSKREHISEKSIEKDPKKFYHGCAGKRSYPSRRVALGIIRVMHDEKLHPYKCACGKWHIGQ